MKALWFGRPMVLVPWGRDQAGVAARADALGVATVVSRADANPDSLCKAIAQALWDDDMRAQAAEHSERLGMTNPPERAADAIETLL
jgi:UDP:flavonoid glycosyltransferase YjiC (YdhE family)